MLLRHRLSGGGLRFAQNRLQGARICENDPIDLHDEQLKAVEAPSDRQTGHGHDSAYRGNNA